MEPLVIVISLLIIVLILRLRRRLSKLKEQNQDILDQLDRIEYRLGNIQEMHKASEASPVNVPPLPITQPDESSEEKLAETNTNNPEIITSEQIPETTSTTVFPANDVTEESSPGFEQTVGVNIFSKIGILVLVLGIGFFVKYAIDNEWINETARTILGLGVGGVLWGIAYYMRNTYRNFSSVLAGGGFAVNFVTVGIAYNFYSLFSSSVALSILIILTILLIVGALLQNRRELAMAAVFGGYIAPFMAAAPEGSFGWLCVYILLMSASVVILSIRTRWWELPSIGCFMAYGGMIYGFFVSGQTAPDTAFYTAIITYVLFCLPIVWVISENLHRRLLLILFLTAFVANNFAFVWFSLHVMEMLPVLFAFKGIAPMLSAIVNAIGFYLIWRRGELKVIQNMLLGMMVVMVSLYFPIQYARVDVVMASLSIDALIILWCYGMTGRRILLFTGNFLLAVIYILLMVIYGTIMSIDHSFPAEHLWTYLISGASYISISTIIMPRYKQRFSSDPKGKGGGRLLYFAILWCGISLVWYSSSLWFNLHLSASAANQAFLILYGLSVASIGLLLRENGGLGWIYPASTAILFGLLANYSDHTQPVAPLGWCAVVITIAAMIIQGFYTTRPHHTPAYKVYFALCFTAIAVTLSMVVMNQFDAVHLVSTGISGTLTICGAAEMLLGMRSKSKALRITSIVTFSAVLIKLGFYDIWRLPPLGRIVVFILLGVTLLTVSFLYLRISRNKEDNSQDMEE